MISRSIAIKLMQLVSLPKTIYFCFRVFPFGVARKLPVQVAWNVKLKKLRKNAMRIEGDIKRFQVKIGLGETNIIPHRPSQVFLEDGLVTFRGTALLGAGIVLANEGKMTIGDNFYSNTNCTIWCSESITFGRDALLGWNVTVRDSDGHTVVDNGAEKPMTKPIEIGDHCWLGSESHVLKGTKMGNDCIVGFGSTVTKAFPVNNAVIAGSPAALRKENVNWIH